MSELLSVLLVLVSLFFALPLARVVLPTNLAWFPLPLLTGLGLSVGIMSLFLAFLALVARSVFGSTAVLLLMAVVVVLGSFSHMRYRQSVPVQGEKQPEAIWQDDPLLGLVLGAVLVLSAGMVLVALYYPFVGSDAIAIYAYAARKIFFGGGLAGWRIPDMDWYGGSYPLLVPLSYVYAWLVAGEVNEYLAKIYPAAFQIATVGATYVLGRQLFSHRAGLLGALTLSLTPLFTRWDLYGYADVPFTFYLVMATIMVYDWLASLRWRSALLGGVMFGLALWTKNSAIPFAVFLAIAVALLGFPLWRAASAGRRRKLLFQASMFVVCTLMVAGWWYIRNWVLYDYFIPLSAVWIDQVHREVWNLIPLWQITRVGAPLYLAGLVYAGWRVAGNRWDWSRIRVGFTERAGIVLLLCLVLPYFVLWWYLLSYMNRFLIFVLPMLAVLAGYFLDDILWPRIPRSSIARVGVGVVIVGASLFSAYGAKDLEIIKRLLTKPAQTTAEKRMDRWGSLVTAYEHVRTLAKSDATARVLTTSGHMYAFDQDPQFIHAHPTTLSNLDGFDYLIWVKGMTEEYQDDPARRDAKILQELKDSNSLKLIYQIDGHRVYQVIWSRSLVNCDG